MCPTKRPGFRGRFVPDVHPSVLPRFDARGIPFNVISTILTMLGRMERQRGRVQTLPPLRHSPNDTDKRDRAGAGGRYAASLVFQLSGKTQRMQANPVQLAIAISTRDNNGKRARGVSERKEGRKTCFLIFFRFGDRG